MSNQVETFVSRRLDFSDPEDAAKVLKDLGGEEFLKNNYPDVYAAYRKTVEKHRQQKGQLSDSNSMGLKGGAFAGPISLVAKPAALKNSAAGDTEQKGNLMGVTSVQGENTWVTGTVKGYMKNLTQDILLHSFVRKLYNENYCECIHERNVEDVASFGKQNIQNSIESKAILTDGTMECLESYSNVYVVKGGICPVAYMVVNAPRSSMGNNPIIMMYARTPDHGETIDYNYPNNNIIPGTDAVKTLFPVKGKITFSDDFKPVKFSLESKSGKPTLQYKGKGVCTYNYSYEEIAACFKISDNNPQVVEFELKEDWNANLDVSAYLGTTHQASVALQFSFYYETMTDEGKEDIGICISSTGDSGVKFYEATNDTNVYLPFVFIKWGCFAKDTLLLMADGSEKNVSEIRSGDLLMGEHGEPLRVIDPVCGEEAIIYCIRTKNKKLLQVSGMHPIATLEGIIRAQDIQPGMVLRCADGKEDEVEFNYTRTYNDKVYGFITEGGGGLIAANGIWAGNFELQNDNAAISLKAKPVEEEVLKTARQFDMLMDHLESLQ
jgi:hypothetical protein